MKARQLAKEMQDSCGMYHISAVAKIEELQKDFVNLILLSLTINDHLKIEVDHAVFEGSTGDADKFRRLVNELFWKYNELMINR